MRMTRNYELIDTQPRSYEALRSRVKPNKTKINSNK